MKKHLTFILLAITFVFVYSCEKDNPSNPTGTIEYPNQTGQIKSSSIDIRAQGDTISTSEATSRISEWTTVLPEAVSNGLLSVSNYNTLKGVSGAEGIGFSHTLNAALLAYPVDSSGQPITSYLYELDANGGVSKDTSDFEALIDTFAGDGFPSTMILGFDLLGDIVSQSGTSGLIVYNSVDSTGVNEYNYDVVVRSYNSIKSAFGSSGTVSARKGCRVWVPAHVEVYGHFTWWVDGHWRDCDMWETMAWSLENLADICCN